MDRILELIDAYEHAITDKKFSHEDIEFFVERLFQLKNKLQEGK